MILVLAVIGLLMVTLAVMLLTNTRNEHRSEQRSRNLAGAAHPDYGDQRTKKVRS